MKKHQGKKHGGRGVSNDELRRDGRNIAKLKYQFGGSAKPASDIKRGK